MDEVEIERVISALERARDDLEAARVQVVALPDTPHWSGSARYSADARTQELVSDIAALVSTVGTLVSRARADRAAWREDKRAREWAGGW